MILFFVSNWYQEMYESFLCVCDLCVDMMWRINIMNVSYMKFSMIGVLLSGND